MKEAVSHWTGAASRIPHPASRRVLGLAVIRGVTTASSAHATVVKLAAESPRTALVAYPPGGS